MGLGDVMSIRVLWKILDAAIVDIGAYIASDGANYVNPFKRLSGAYNALYETIFDAAAPGQAGAQTYEGHDHGLSGPPITRGAVFSQDWGNSALINFQPGSTNWQDWRPIGTDNAQGFDRAFMYEVSPKLPAPTVLEGWINYSASNSDFELRVSEANTLDTLAQDQNVYKLPALSGSESSRWLFFSYVPANPGNVNYLRLYARAGNFDASNAPVLSVYSIVICETPATTLPNDGTIAL